MKPHSTFNYPFKSCCSSKHINVPYRYILSGQIYVQSQQFYLLRVQKEEKTNQAKKKSISTNFKHLPTAIRRKGLSQCSFFFRFSQLPVSHRLIFMNYYIVMRTAKCETQQFNMQCLFASSLYSAL